ncbi:MAG: hypothetical protein GEV03_22195 [Streptosporangiales bacterium]|nr:hypothetical protein [Streptosporangiales bacterium]
MTRRPRVSSPRTGSQKWLIDDDGIIDPIAIDIAAAGTRPVQLTPTERRLAAAVILARGGTPQQVARRLHMAHHNAAALCADLTRGEAA